MAEWLTACADLAEDLRSIPGTQLWEERLTVIFNCISRGLDVLLTSEGNYSHMCIPISSSHAQTHKYKNKSLKNQLPQFSSPSNNSLSPRG